MGSWYVFSLSCPSATFPLQRGDFVPREWLAAKDLAGSSPRILANEDSGHGPRPDVERRSRYVKLPW